MFAIGLTFRELSAHTVDKDGKRAFVNAKEMEVIRKVKLICSSAFPMFEEVDAFKSRICVNDKALYCSYFGYIL